LKFERQQIVRTVTTKFCAQFLQSFAIVSLLQFSEVKIQETPRLWETDHLGIMKTAGHMIENISLPIEKTKN